MSDGRLPVRRRWLGWTIGALLTFLVLSIGWVTVRGIGAVNELQQVATLSSQMKGAVGDGDLDSAESLAKRISLHAGSAHDLTSDPIWRAYSLVPWLGANFTAVSEVSAIADDIASNAVAPVLSASHDIDISSLGFAGGAVDLTPFTKIRRPLAEAAEILNAADERARRIDADATLPPLADAVRELQSTVSEVTTAVGALHGASVLLPTMLGGEGGRNYVIVMQNNAELRSSGGIVGAIALLHAENGRISLTQQPSTSEFPVLDTPLPLSESTVALFEERPGRYIQDATSIPDFTEAAPLISQRWQGRFGTTVDGVIAVDAVMTRNLLEATGPLSFGPFTADSGNVVSLLLSEIYAQVPDPALQDQIFGQAAAAMLGAALSNANAKTLISAFAASADEGRIRIWSAHEDEQRVLESSTLSGTITEDAPGEARVGVLFNDTTGGKMDYYADAEISTAFGICGGVPTTQVRVVWTNGAPNDAGTSLPAYVTGNGIFGVLAGNTRTLITIYGPSGATLAKIDRDGEEDSVQTTTFGSRSAVQHEVQLEPGRSATITATFVGKDAGIAPREVLHTPLVNDPEVKSETLTCGS